MLTTFPAAAATYRRDLGDGLILRWSTAADTDNIGQLCSLAFRDKADEPPREFFIPWIRRLMRGDHYLMGPGDYGIVEDTRKEGNPIIACTCLWRHEWSYEGIPFKVGRPEIVASDPGYRNRGLIRALFEMIHARSESEGHLLQAITGIPYFYRQFGYEYALDLETKRTTYLSLIPELKEGESEPYILREATVEDIPFMMACYYRRSGQSIVRANIPERNWRYALEGWKANPEKDRTEIHFIITDASHTAQGYLITTTRRRRKDLAISGAEFAQGTNLQAMLPSILRALKAYGLQIPAEQDAPPMHEISFGLGPTHPLYDVLGTELGIPNQSPYAWYIRVADIPAFIRHIAPALGQRLAASSLAGYHGEVKIDHYNKGLRMVFADGILKTAERWQIPAYDPSAGAGLPALIFIQLLLGYRSLDELNTIFPEVWADNNTGLVLKTLFPTRPSYVPDNQ